MVSIQQNEELVEIKHLTLTTPRRQKVLTCSTRQENQAELANLNFITRRQCL